MSQRLSGVTSQIYFSNSFLILCFFRAAISSLTDFSAGKEGVLDTNMVINMKLYTNSSRDPGKTARGSTETSTCPHQPRSFMGIKYRQGTFPILV